MAKYDPLRDWLSQQRASRVAMTFEQIAELVGEMPASARNYREWWANEAGDTTHVQCRAWLQAGYSVESVELEDGRVTFRRTV